MTSKHIDIAGFVRAEPSRDGLSVKLVLVDAQGATVVMSLRLDCLAELIADLPRPLPPPDVVSDVRTWRLDGLPSGGDLTLTLQTRSGHVAAYRLTAGQLAGIATIALHDKPAASGLRALN